MHQFLDMSIFPSRIGPIRMQYIIRHITYPQFFTKCVMAKNSDKIDKCLREEAKHVLHDKHLGKTS